jgi:peptidoglycan pentaglycine glycine transferase (the first glycine)
MDDFLQSEAWQKISQASGHKTILIKKEDSRNKLIVSSLLIEKKPKFFPAYYYSPRGPIFYQAESLKHWFLILKEYLKVAKEKKVFFLKLDPALIEIDIFKQALNQLNIKFKESISVQPSQTIVLDLSLSLDELLKQMKPKTRYNIKVALKHDLKLVEDIGDFEEFFQLLSATKDRDNFRLHKKEHYLNLINNGVRLISMKKDNVILASGLFSFYNNKVTYLHGASNYQHRSKMAPYQLHWELIKKAKAEGYKHYDFYGIDENRWPGVTRFKRGFGGFELNYPPTYDLIFKPATYHLYNLLKKIKRI